MINRFHLFVNTFLNVTKHSFKKAVRLSIGHDASLKEKMDANPGDADWALIYNRYHTLHLALLDAYNKWKSGGGRQEGQTLNVEQLLTLLVSKVNRWDILTQTVFLKSSPEYKSIFPDGHFPFIDGTIDTKILAVEQLGLNLVPYPALDGVRGEVEPFYTTLYDARSAQEGAKSAKSTLSDKLEACRRSAMIMQYGNAGFLINKFMNHPDQAAAVFDLQLLRNHIQVLFTGILDPSENESVLVHTFLPDDEIRIKLKGEGQAKIYLATVHNGTDSTPVIIDGNTNKLITASEFGITEYGTHRYLTAINDGLVELEYDIHLL